MQSTLPFDFAKAKNDFYSTEECLLLAFDLIEGLLLAKGRLIFHWDIKHENIIFITFGKKGYKFADCGVAFCEGANN